MALSPRKKQAASNADIEKLADKLADKPYEGTTTAAAAPVREEKPVLRSFAISRELDAQLHRMAAMNALNENGPKNVSALLRHIVTEYLEAHPID